MLGRRNLIHAATYVLTVVAGLARQIMPISAQQKNVSASSAHVFSFDRLKGGKINLSDYKNKVVMVVNTASFCGFANQFKDLQTLWSRY